MRRKKLKLNTDKIFKAISLVIGIIILVILVDYTLATLKGRDTFININTNQNRSVVSNESDIESVSRFSINNVDVVSSSGTVTEVLSNRTYKVEIADGTIVTIIVNNDTLVGKSWVKEESDGTKISSYDEISLNSLTVSVGDKVFVTYVESNLDNKVAEEFVLQ